MTKLLAVFHPQDMDEREKQIDALGLDAEVFYAYSDEEVANYIGEVDVIFAIPFLVEKHLDTAKNLKWFQSSFSGIDALCGEDMRSDYILTNVRDIYSEIMAEYVLGYVLFFSKNIGKNLASQAKKEWNKVPHTKLKEQKIGIIGTGSIGSEIAAYASSFGMLVRGLSRSGKSAENFAQMYSWEEKEDFFTDLDYVVSVLPATPETTDIYNDAMFSSMDKKSIFMNIGRGTSVDEDALVRALQEKKIQAAVLDVFKTEALPAQSPLWELENLYITPHISGYDTDFAPVLEIFAENFKKYKNGEKLDYIVDFKKGY